MTLLGKLMALNNAIADHGSAEIPAKLLAERNELSQKLRELFAPIVEAYNEGLLSSEEFYMKLTMEAY
jgi:hypothetical protein